MCFHPGCSDQLRAPTTQQNHRSQPYESLRTAFKLFAVTLANLAFLSQRPCFACSRSSNTFRASSEYSHHGFFYLTGFWSSTSIHRRGVERKGRFLTIYLDSGGAATVLCVPALYRGPGIPRSPPLPRDDGHWRCDKKAVRQQTGRTISFRVKSVPHNRQEDRSADVQHALQFRVDRIRIRTGSDQAATAVLARQMRSRWRYPAA